MNNNFYYKMINNKNFYRDFDLIFSKLNLEMNDKTNEIYNELLSLYDVNYNQNIVKDLEIKSFKIDNDGIIS